MSIWGKITGGVAGFAIGLGRENRQVAFSVAVIVLAAKMATINASYDRITKQRGIK